MEVNSLDRALAFLDTVNQNRQLMDTCVWLWVLLRSANVDQRDWLLLLVFDWNLELWLSSLWIMQFFRVLFLCRVLAWKLIRHFQCLQLVEDILFVLIDEVNSCVLQLNQAKLLNSVEVGQKIFFKINSGADAQLLTIKLFDKVATALMQAERF